MALAKKITVRYNRKKFKREGGKMTVAKLATKVRALSSSNELKELTAVTGQLNTVVYGTPYGAVMNLIAEGDDYNTRDGRHILARRAIIKGNIFGDGTHARVVRIMLIKDTQSSGNTVPATNAILESVAQWSITTSPILDSAKPRFKVLVDKRYATGVGSQGNHLVTINKKLNFKMHYVDATNTAVGKNALMLLIVTDSEANGYVDIQLSTVLQWYG